MVREKESRLPNTAWLSRHFILLHCSQEGVWGELYCFTVFYFCDQRIRLKWLWEVMWLRASLVSHILSLWYVSSSCPCGLPVRFCNFLFSICCFILIYNDQVLDVSLKLPLMLSKLKLLLMFSCDVWWGFELHQFFNSPAMWLQTMFSFLCYFGNIIFLVSVLRLYNTQLQMIFLLCTRCPMRVFPDWM